MNNKIVEKLNEYDVVLNRAGRYGASVRSIITEEIADVIIALYWIFKRYKVEENDVIDWLEYKCNRMDERLGRGDFY